MTKVFPLELKDVVSPEILAEVEDAMKELVPCPACDGQGYIRDAVAAKNDCNYCSGQKKVTKDLADEWPLK